MALLVSKLSSDLVGAFKTPEWTVAANLYATAINTFFITGMVTTTVTGTVTPPPPGTSFVAVGTGTGNPVTTGLPSLITSCVSAFKSPSWATAGNIIANGINTLVSTSTITTTVAGALTGIGVGTIVPTGLGLLTTQLSTAFSSGQAWEQTAMNIATAVNTFIKTCTVNTTDTGSIPPVSWVGVGVGTIA